MARDTADFGTSPLERQVAVMWVAMPGVDWWHPVLGNMAEVLAPLAALKVYGTSAELESKYETVRAAAIINRDIPMNEDDRKRLAPPLNEVRMYLGRLYAGAVRAEKHLARMGWKFDAEKRKTTRDAKGHRGRDLLTECAWAVYTAKHPAVLGKSKDKGNCFDARRRIARILAPYFEASELSPKSGAPIYTAIYNRERGLK